MDIFKALNIKINDWFESNDTVFTLSGFESEQFLFLLKSFIENHTKLTSRPLVICTYDAEAAEKIVERIKDIRKDCLYLPDLEHSPYQDVLVEERVGQQTFFALSNFYTKSSDSAPILVTTAAAFRRLLPPSNFFQTSAFKIELSDIISPEELAAKLVGLGYSSSLTVEEPGTFSKKGEIFDIFPSNDRAIRINYFDDMIEEMHLIDLETNMRIADQPIECLTISPAVSCILDKTLINNLRASIAAPSADQKEKFSNRREILQRLNDGQLFENYFHYLPFFFEDSHPISTFLKETQGTLVVLNKEECDQSIVDLKEEFEAQYQEVMLDKTNACVFPPFERVFNFNDSQQKQILVSENCLQIDPSGRSFHIDLKSLFSLTNDLASVERSLGQNSHLKKLVNLLNMQFRNSKKIFFCLHDLKRKEEILNILSHHGLEDLITSKFEFLLYNLSKGFYYPLEDRLVLSESDLFGPKTKKVRTKKRSVDMFAEQISSLKQNDYVIHNEFGIGKYLGLEKMTMGNQETDFLLIEYSEGDKVYLPVYRINLLQKFSDAETTQKVASLRKNKFNLVKQRARESVKKLAFSLLELQAKRESSKGFAFSPPDNLFRDFELEFPFKETIDQANAIEDTIRDMQDIKPMDRLICGDVGFGKTEVAMRASFKAVLDKKQVSVLVPTTILALQHYNSFVKRFKNFPVTIEFISRFKSTEETRKILERVEKNEVDILIGTHKLLSDKVKFHDLGLVIVDEEQRFGVGHKEKLKLLKTSVDFLTLTATPIPRTLQLSFLGIKDLSLIQTAPPKRQSVKSYVIKFNESIIKDALEKELQRDGQIFIVNNKIAGLETLAATVEELVPGAKKVIAHGQMPERELEKRITDFYNKKYQILICTTIIESGIDIPSANTLIIHNAHMFGLSQLHQLRGRIGRSNRKAYAYFAIPPNIKLKMIADKRLKALKNYSSIGGGFSLASADLELRGAGDILGGEQSGHMEAIGFELYMDLLKETIAELAGNKIPSKKDIEIQIPDNASISENYIENSGQRIKIYKRISNCDNEDELESLRDEMTDQFGLMPTETKNLFYLIKCRIVVKNCCLSKVSYNNNKLMMKFDAQLLEENTKIRDEVVNLFLSRPKVYKLGSEFSVTYTHKEQLTQESVLRLLKDIAHQINPC